MTPTLIFKPRKTLTAALMAATIAASGAISFAPSTAFAVPAGGYADLVETVTPSVVFIEVTQKALPVSAESKLLQQFQNRYGLQVPMPPQAAPKTGLGSGFIISSDGDIVTNHHVVADADEVKVKLSDGRSFTATVVGSDPLTDIALLRVDTDEELPVVEFGSSEDIRVGDEAIAIGNPFGLGGTVTTGIISAKSRDIKSGPFDNYIQTDAAINRGNSGGPLFNADGEVIGVNTAIFSPDGGSVGIGFAVPADMVKTIVADLSADGTIDRGWLGVQIRPMSDEVAAVLGYDAPKGAVIEAVQDDSPADKAGFKAGDIVMSFAGTEIETLRDLPRAVAGAAPDSRQTVTVLRKGRELELEVTLGQLPKQDA
ncbi:MAG: Do family serine endopeptidase [Rhodobacteraceae bacterium]|nr:Do family serine endopeptidase [Paracoccaceae bacterium]